MNPYRILFIIILLSFLLGCNQKTLIVTYPEKTSNLNGLSDQQIYDKSKDLLITRGPKKIFIGIKSYKYRFDISVPYSNTWEIDSTPEKPLSAKDQTNGHFVSVMVNDYEEIPPEEYLQSILDRAKKSGMGSIENSKIFKSAFKSEGRFILKYVFKPNEAPTKEIQKNGWWNYWTAFYANQHWYVAHWSNYEKEDEEKKILFLLSDCFTTF